MVAAHLLRTKNSNTTERRRRDMAPIISLEPATAKRHFPKKSRSGIRPLTDTAALPLGGNKKFDVRGPKS
jgi:hypothetical protein